MLMVGLLGMLVGVVLGMRFRVFVLFPAIALACGVIAAMGFAGNGGVPSSAVAMMAAAAAPPIGHLLRISPRTILAPAPAPLPRPAAASPTPARQPCHLPP